MPRSEFLGQVHKGGMIYPFILLFPVLSNVERVDLLPPERTCSEILDPQSATLIIAAASRRWS